MEWKQISVPSLSNMTSAGFLVCLTDCVVLTLLIVRLSKSLDASCLSSLVVCRHALELPETHVYL